MCCLFLEKECVPEIVFALDYSSIVSDDEFKNELSFVQNLAQSWHLSTEVKVVVYGHDAETLPLTLGRHKEFYRRLRELRKAWAESKHRKIDRALIVAAENFPTGANPGLQPHKVVLLITAGGQQSDAQKQKDEHHLLEKAHEVLSKRNIKAIIVPVGMHTDFKELSLIVKRPQSLYPLCGFGAMTPDGAKVIADNILKTLGKINLDLFSIVSVTSYFWSLVSKSSIFC